MSEIITQKNLADEQSASLALIHELAKNPDVDADKLEQLVNLHNSEKDRQAREQAYRALALFKQEVPIIPKIRDGAKTTNGVTAYKYAAMDNLVRVIKPYVDKHGLSWTFSHDLKEGKQVTTCRVLHISGFTFPETTLPIPLARPQSRLTTEIQSGGITNTYGERYALKAALGLVFTDDDTDGVLPPASPASEPSLDDAISLQLERQKKTDEDLNSALTAKGIDLKDGGWKAQDSNVKSRILSGWSNLFGKEAS